MERSPHTLVYPYAEWTIRNKIPPINQTLQCSLYKPYSAHPHYSSLYLLISNILTVLSQTPDQSARRCATAHLLVCAPPLATSATQRDDVLRCPKACSLREFLLVHPRTRPAHPWPRLAFGFLCRLPVGDYVCDHRARWGKKLRSSSGRHGSLGHLLMQSSCTRSQMYHFYLTMARCWDTLMYTLVGPTEPR